MSAGTARTVHVEQCMGTVFTLDIRDAGDWREATADVVAWLHKVDRVFSTYRADSDISRLQRGELAIADADPDVAAVLDLCAEVQVQTRHWFSATYRGRIDPTGLVKGWAIERAGQMLRAHGARNHAVNGGGDLQLAGESAPGRPWTVGIADPADGQRVLATVSGRDLAVATSGISERGAHLVDPFTGTCPTAYASATVVGPCLTLADSYATAAFLMGADALRWIATVDGYELLLVAADGSCLTSRGWDARGQDGVAA